MLDDRGASPAAPRASRDRGRRRVRSPPCYPPLVWISSYVFSETLFMPLALGCVMVLHAARAARRRRTLRPRRRRADRGGRAARRRRDPGAAGDAVLPAARRALVRPPAALVAGARVLCVGGGGRRCRGRCGTSASYGRFVLVASEGGVTFWTGNHPLAIGEGDLAANPAIKQAEVAFRQAHPGLTAEELEPLYYRDALAHIAAHPGWWLRCSWRRRRSTRSSRSGPRIRYTPRGTCWRR